MFEFSSSETPGFGTWSVINVVDSSSSPVILILKPDCFKIDFASSIVLFLTSGKVTVFVLVVDEEFEELSDATIDRAYELSKI